MVKELKKTSEQWYNSLPSEDRVIILNPDGWDRTNYQYSYFVEKITLDEFQNRVLRSTSFRNF